MFPPAPSPSLPATFSMAEAPSGKPIVIQVDPRGLVLPTGQTIEWASIQEVNLSLVPESQYNDRHLLCRIYAQGKPLQLRASLNQALEMAGYAGFLQAMHLGLQAALASPRYTRGLRSKGGYRLFMASIGLVFLAMELLIVYAVHERGKLATGIAFMAVIAGAGYFLLRLAYRLLRPGTYDPAAIPPDLLGR